MPGNVSSEAERHRDTILRALALAQLLRDFDVGAVRAAIEARRARLRALGWRVGDRNDDDRLADALARAQSEIVAALTVTPEVPAGRQEAP